MRAGVRSHAAKLQLIVLFVCSAMNYAEEDVEEVQELAIYDKADAGDSNPMVNGGGSGGVHIDLSIDVIVALARDEAYAARSRVEETARLRAELLAEIEEDRAAQEAADRLREAQIADEAQRTAAELEAAMRIADAEEAAAAQAEAAKRANEARVAAEEKAARAAEEKQRVEREAELKTQQARHAADKAQALLLDAENKLAAAERHARERVLAESNNVPTELLVAMQRDGLSEDEQQKAINAGMNSISEFREWSDSDWLRFLDIDIIARRREREEREQQEVAKAREAAAKALRAAKDAERIRAEERRRRMIELEREQEVADALDTIGFSKEGRAKLSNLTNMHELRNMTSRDLPAVQALDLKPSDIRKLIKYAETEAALYQAALAEEEQSRVEIEREKELARQRQAQAAAEQRAEIEAAALKKAAERHKADKELVVQELSKRYTDEFQAATTALSQQLADCQQDAKRQMQEARDAVVNASQAAAKQQAAALEKAAESYKADKELVVQELSGYQVELAIVHEGLTDCQQDAKRHMQENDELQAATTALSQQLADCQQDAKRQMQEARDAVVNASQAAAKQQAAALEKAAESHKADKELVVQELSACQVLLAEGLTDCQQDAMAKSDELAECRDSYQKGLHDEDLSKYLGKAGVPNDSVRNLSAGLLASVDSNNDGVGTLEEFIGNFGDFQEVVCAYSNQMQQRRDEFTRRCLIFVWVVALGIYSGSMAVYFAHWYVSCWRTTQDEEFRASRCVLAAAKFRCIAGGVPNGRYEWGWTLYGIILVASGITMGRLETCIFGELADPALFAVLATISFGRICCSAWGHHLDAIYQHQSRVKELETEVATLREKNQKVHSLDILLREQQHQVKAEYMRGYESGYQQRKQDMKDAKERMKTDAEAEKQRMELAKARKQNAHDELHKVRFCEKCKEKFTIAAWGDKCKAKWLDPCQDSSMPDLGVTGNRTHKEKLKKELEHQTAGNWELQGGKGKHPTYQYFDTGGLGAPNMPIWTHTRYEGKRAGRLVYWELQSSHE